MDDVNVVEAAKIAHDACFENSGQCCWYVKYDIDFYFVHSSLKSRHACNETKHILPLTIGIFRKIKPFDFK